MKKIVVFLFLLSSVINEAKGQDKNFGIIAGSNYATWTGDLSDLSELERRFGLYVAAFAEFNLNNALSIYTSLGYSSIGFNREIELRNTIDDFPTLVEVSNRFQYLTIPALLKIDISNRLHVLAGPQVGFLLTSVTVSDEDAFGESRISDSGDFELDYGGKIGISLDISSQFFTQLSYYQGFSNVTRGGITDFTNNNSFAQLALGFRIF